MFTTAAHFPMTQEHLQAVLKEVIPHYLERDDLDGLASDLAIYISRHVDDTQDITNEINEDLIFLKEDTEE